MGDLIWEQIADPGIESCWITDTGGLRTGAGMAQCNAMEGGFASASHRSYGNGNIVYVDFAARDGGAWCGNSWQASTDTQMASPLAYHALLYGNPDGGTPWTQSYDACGNPLASLRTFPFADRIDWVAIDDQDLALVAYSPAGASADAGPTNGIWLNPDNTDASNSFAFPSPPSRVWGPAVGGGFAIDGYWVFADGETGIPANGMPVSAGFQLVAGKRAYAVPTQGTCAPSVNLYSASGGLCGSLSLMSPDGGCPQPATVFRDGSLACTIPWYDQAAGENGSRTCWWPGLLR